MTAPTTFSTACRRCLNITPDVHARLLWNSSCYMRLCDDCNTLVQGPDFIDVETGNRP